MDCAIPLVQFQKFEIWSTALWKTISGHLKPGLHDEISISTSSATFDVHKRKHKKNATFVLLMFMLTVVPIEVFLKY
jgi:hypothetical protein